MAEVIPVSWSMVSNRPRACFRISASYAGRAQITSWSESRLTLRWFDQNVDHHLEQLAAAPGRADQVPAGQLHPDLVRVAVEQLLHRLAGPRPGRVDRHRPRGRERSPASAGGPARPSGRAARPRRLHRCHPLGGPGQEVTSGQVGRVGRWRGGRVRRRSGTGALGGRGTGRRGRARVAVGLGVTVGLTVVEGVGLAVIDGTPSSTRVGRGDMESVGRGVGRGGRPRIGMGGQPGGIGARQPVTAAIAATATAAIADRRSKTGAPGAGCRSPASSWCSSGPEAGRGHRAPRPGERRWRLASCDQTRRPGLRPVSQRSRKVSRRFSSAPVETSGARPSVIKSVIVRPSLAAGAWRSTFGEGHTGLSHGRRRR